MTESIPQRLRDLDPKIIRFLDRLDDDGLEALEWCADLTGENRDRFDKFLRLTIPQFDAGFKLVELWTRMAWLFDRLGWLGENISMDHYDRCRRYDCADANP